MKRQSHEELERRRFTLADQKQFAHCSGDFNPIHMDSEWAASIFPGETVVHGMHAVLWGCNAYLSKYPQQNLRIIQASFDKPILLNEEVVAVCENTDSGVRVVFYVENTKLIAVNLVLSSAPAPPYPPTFLTKEKQLKADFHSIISVATLSGQLSLSSDAQELESLYPVLTKKLGITTVVGLASLSTLVGMKCPGLYGLFSAFECEISGVSGPLNYEVTKADPRFNRLEVRISGYGLDGTLSAFITKNEGEKSGKSLAKLRINRTEFKGAQPLIIGASNGLGSATARILAMGGAVPIVTWNSSSRLINDLQVTIEGLGSQCICLHCDIRHSEQFIDSLLASEWKGHHVYFFATPRIFRRRIKTFHPEVLQDFIGVYVEGLYGLVRALAEKLPDRNFKFFYPSSVLSTASKRESLEYGIAKMAGEQLCNQLTEAYPKFCFQVERLPGIRTRQTETVIPVSLLSAEETMLPFVRQMQSDEAR